MSCTGRQALSIDSLVHADRLAAQVLHLAAATAPGERDGSQVVRLLLLHFAACHLLLHLDRTTSQRHRAKLKACCAWDCMFEAQRLLAESHAALLVPDGSGSSSPSAFWAAAMARG